MSRLRNGVAQYDAALRLRRHNPAYAQLIGLHPQALQPGMSVVEIVARQRDAGEFDSTQAAAIINAMTTRNLALGWRHERTRPGWPHHPLREPAHAGWRLAGRDHLDATEAHQAEQDVRRRVALQDALMDALPVGVAVYGPDRVLTRVNPAYNRIMA